MAYGDKYTFSWTSDANVDCRVRIQQEGYSGPAETLTPSGRAFEITWGTQNTGRVYVPLMVSSAELYVFDDDGAATQLTEIFGDDETDWRVRFEQHAGQAWTLAWTGYLATDLWQDDPYTGSETIRLEAIDGLALLEKRAYNQTGDQDLMQVLYDILSGLGLTDTIDIGMEWYPYADTAIASSENPLERLLVTDEAFVDVRADEPNVPFGERQALLGVLQRFGLELMQVEGTWHIRQRSQISPTGDLTQWTYSGSAGNPGTQFKNLIRTLPHALRDGSERPRSLHERLESVTVSHTYEDLGFLTDARFESGYGAFTVLDSSRVDRLPFDTIRGDDANGVSVDPPQEFQNSKYCVELQSANNDDLLIETSGDALILPNTASQLELIVDARESPSTQTFGSWIPLKLQVGGFSLQAQWIPIAAEYELADSGGTIRIQPAPGTDGQVILPRGADVMLVETSYRNGGQVIDNTMGTYSRIRLEEPLRGGDDKLVGAISGSEMPAGLIQYGYALFYAFEPVDAATRLVPQRSSVSFFTERSIRAPLVTPGGTAVQGELSLGFGMNEANASGPGFIDNVRTQLIGRDGQPIEASTYTAVASGPAGRELELSVPIGDGPTKNHPRGITVDTEPGEIAYDWKVGAYGASEAPSGVGLNELLATEIIRYERSPLKRYRLSLSVREAGDILPHYLYQIDGDLYAVSFLRRAYGTGDSVVELTQLIDWSSAGLQTGTAMETDAPSGGGGSGVVVSSSGSSGASDWDAITGKPGGLLSTSGAGSTTLGVPQTRTLTGGDGIAPVGDLSTGRTISMDVTGQFGFDGAGKLELAPGAITSSELDASDSYTMSGLDVNGPLDVTANVPDAALTIQNTYDSGEFLAFKNDVGNTVFRLNQVGSGAAFFDMWDESGVGGSGEIFRISSNYARFTVGIEETAIGQTTPAAGSFTTLDASTWDLDLGEVQDVDESNADAGEVLKRNASNDGYVVGPLDIDQLAANTITINTSTGLSGGGSVQLGTSITLSVAPNSIGDGQISYPLTLFDADSGEMDGVTIGATSPAEATFTNAFADAIGVGVSSVTPPYSIQTDQALLLGGGIYSDDLSTGFSGSGYRLIGSGLSWLDSLALRSEFTAYSLEIKKIRHSAGPLSVGFGGGKVSSVNAPTDGTSDYGFTFAAPHDFAVGDLIHAQGFTGSSIYENWMEVMNIPSDTEADVNLLSGPALFSDKTFVTHGSTSDPSRQGLLYMDPEQPALDILDGIDAQSDWGTAAVLKGRIGNLNGSYGVGTDTYGIAFGNPSTQNLIATADEIALRSGTDAVIRLDNTGKAFVERLMELGSGGIFRNASTDFKVEGDSGFTIYDASTSSFTDPRAYTIRDASDESLIGALRGAPSELLLEAQTSMRLAAVGGSSTLVVEAGDDINIRQETTDNGLGTNVFAQKRNTTSGANARLNVRTARDVRVEAFDAGGTDKTPRLEVRTDTSDPFVSIFDGGTMSVVVQGGDLFFNGLPSSNPGISGTVWYDPNDNNRLKYVP